MDITVLKKAGLSDKEIKVYLGLLEYGAISVRGLVEIVSLNRGTVYDILKKLQEVGLVTYYHHDTKQKFTAEDPEKLVLLMEEKEKELSRAREKVAKTIPELKALQDKGGHKPTSKFYEGKAGVRIILENVLETMQSLGGAKKEYYIYSATEASDDVNNALPNFTNKRIKNKIKVKAISLAPGGKGGELAERRWLGTKDKSATFIIVYSGKCAFISRDLNGKPVGVIIENEMIYETQRIIFLQLWKLLK